MPRCVKNQIFFYMLRTLALFFKEIMLTKLKNNYIENLNLFIQITKYTNETVFRDHIGCILDETVQRLSM